MSDSKKPKLSEIYSLLALSRPLEHKESGEAILYLMELVKRLGKMLGKLADESGWHGTGANDLDIYYCEHCRKFNEDWSKIEHEPSCLVWKARALLKELEL